MDAMFSCLLFLITILSLFAGRGNAEKAQALFVFGDSSVDTGNHDPYNQSVNQPWRRPYGLTWPGYPTGRYASGKMQTDFWGLPAPIPYELLKSHECKANAEKIRQGVNFAVGGSGIFRDYGFTTVPQQVKQFKKLIGGSQGFDSHKLSQSVVLMSVVGNDYGAFLNINNGSIKGLVDLAKPVVSGIIDAVTELYESGLRNFAVSNILSFGCMPQNGRTSCISTYDNITALHTRLLREGVESLRSNFKEISIIISDFVTATNYVISNHRQYGFVDLLVPCCAAKGRVDMCAEVDKVGRPLFEVCSNVDEKFYLDFGHPTQRGWHAIMSLYSNGVKGDNKTMSFIEGAPNIIAWLHSIGFVAYNVSSQA
ncbi:GDSL esterase/lipase At3g09930 isoform X2 [Cryptomeria japonica]|uniref:GDSL esterase/lipase At3g09930 isoform X2 n=1 Tax=Cryptomeria japonica TaxID=3369 RepID=UPI0027DA9100|nr:GDSL esterase/lipase At3g09930 isoform X2 [Cryptomeria japonica]